MTKPQQEVITEKKPISQNKIVSQKETLEKQDQPQRQSKEGAGLTFYQNWKEMIVIDKERFWQK